MNNIRRSLLSVAVALAAASAAWAQTSRQEMYDNPELSSGLYLVYPETPGVQTKAPKGYRPFYISHFSRHGSRWLADSNDYRKPLNALRAADSAAVLTPLGKDVLRRLEIVCEDAYQRDGELSPKGIRQHRGISERMYAGYGEAFSKGAVVTAWSTQVPRCILSMDSFCDRLKEFDPGLRISRDASRRDYWFLHSGNQQYNEYVRTHDIGFGSYRESTVHPDRFIASLFSDQDYIDAHIDKTDLYKRMYAIASVMQNTDLDIRFYDLFRPEELFDLWQGHNAWFFTVAGPNPLAGEMAYRKSLGTLKHIMDTADEYIAGGMHGATLRFSHDAYLVPLCTTLRLDDCMGQSSDPREVHKYWCSHAISPMAGNVQIIFFRNKAGDVILKFLHNEVEVGIPVETDIYPFYRWEDVRKYYQDTYDYENVRF